VVLKQSENVNVHVVHLCGFVLLDTALSLTTVADKVGASSWLRLVRKANMMDSFNDLRNFTAFLPSNDAFKVTAKTFLRVHFKCFKKFSCIFACIFRTEKQFYCDHSQKF